MKHWVIIALLAIVVVFLTNENLKRIASEASVKAELEIERSKLAKVVESQAESQKAAQESTNELAEVNHDLRSQIRTIRNALEGGTDDGSCGVSFHDARLLAIAADAANNGDTGVPSGTTIATETFTRDTEAAPPQVTITELVNYTVDVVEVCGEIRNDREALIKYIQENWQNDVQESDN